MIPMTLRFAVGPNRQLRIWPNSSSMTAAGAWWVARVAAISSESLLELAVQADAGFDRRIFADLLTMLQRYPDRRFDAYKAPLTTSQQYESDSKTGVINY